MTATRTRRMHETGISFKDRCAYAKKTQLMHDN